MRFANYCIVFYKYFKQLSTIFRTGVVGASGEASIKLRMLLCLYRQSMGLLYSKTPDNLIANRGTHCKIYIHFLKENTILKKTFLFLKVEVSWPLPGTSNNKGPLEESDHECPVRFLSLWPAIVKVGQCFLHSCFMCENLHFLSLYFIFLYIFT